MQGKKHTVKKCKFSNNHLDLLIRLIHDTTNHFAQGYNSLQSYILQYITNSLGIPESQDHWPGLDNVAL